MKPFKLLSILFLILTSFNSFGQKWNYKNISMGLGTPPNSHVIYINVLKSTKYNIEIRSLSHTSDGYRFNKATIESTTTDYYYEITEEPFTGTDLQLKRGRYKITLYGKTWTYGIGSDGGGSLRVGWYGK